MKWDEKAAVGLLRQHDLSDHRIREYGNRLAIWRKDGARLTWNEVQQVKQSVWGDRVAVEVYPAQSDVINIKNTRHLWWSESLSALVAGECVHPEFSHEA